MALCTGVPAQAVVPEEPAPAPAVPKVEAAPEFGNFTVEVSTKVGFTNAVLGSVPHMDVFLPNARGLDPSASRWTQCPKASWHIGRQDEIQGEHCWTQRVSLEIDAMP